MVNGLLRGVRVLSLTAVKREGIIIMVSWKLVLVLVLRWGYFELN
jgi:hypothetical protein